MNIPCPVETCDRPRRGDQHICGACEAELRRALESVPELAAELEVTLTRQASRTSGGGGTGKTPPLPYDPRATEAAAIVRSSLGGWVRELHRAPESWPEDNPAAMAAWLCARLSRLLRHPAPEEAHGEIVSAVRAAERVIDRGPVPRYAGPCDSCAMPLYAKEGAVWVRCRECGVECSVGERREWMLTAVEEILLPAHGVAHTLTGLVAPTTTAAVRQWVARGRLLAHGHDAAGRPLYRVGDGVDLLVARLARDAEREAGRRETVVA